MSLSWRDRVYIALAPSRIDVMRMAGIVRRAAVYDELIPGIEVMGDAPWRGPLQALADAMPRFAPRGAQCSVVLSNHFCRYVVVPGNTGLTDEREMEAYARLRFEETYGAGAAAAWEIRIGNAEPGAARLACAIDRALMDELRRTCSAARVKLTSVRPLLAAAFDQSRARLGAGQFWFAAAEQGRLCLAAVENHAWRAVLCQRIGRNVADELRAMLDRALVAVPGMTADDVYLFSRDQTGERARALPGIKVLPLAGTGEQAGADDVARARVFA